MSRVALLLTNATKFYINTVCTLLSGVKGRRIRELTSVVQKRFKFPEGSVELYAEKVANRGLSAIAQAESLRYKLLGGLAVRRYPNLSANCSASAAYNQQQVVSCVAAASNAPVSCRDHNTLLCGI